MADWLISISPPLEGERPDSYRVYTRDADVADSTYSLAADNVTESSVTLKDLLPQGRLSVAVVPVTAGVEWAESTWRTSVISPGSTADLAVPNAPTNFSASQQGGNIVFSWTAPTNRTIAEYEIRRGGTWVTAIKRATFAGPATGHTMGWQISGEKTYLIKAKATGQESAVASVTLTIHAQTEYVLEANTDESGTNYAGGTLTNLNATAGVMSPLALDTSYSNLTAAYTTYTHPWWWTIHNDGTYVTATTDEGVVVDQQIEVGMTLAQGGSVPAYTKMRMNYRDAVDTSGNALDPDARSVGQRISYTGDLLDGMEVKIEIDTAVGGAPTWVGYRPWNPGTEYRFRYYRLRFTFDLVWPYTYPTVTALSHRTLRKNRKWEGSVTINSTGGTAVDYSSAGFTKVPSVGVTVTGSGAGLWAIQAFHDNASATGCDVFVSNGVNETSGVTVDVQALGV